MDNRFYKSVPLRRSLSLLNKTPLALALALASPAFAQGDAARQPPVELRADQLESRPDLETTATGNVEVRRGPLVIRADELGYRHAEDIARARGNVSIRRNGNRYTGSEMQLQLQRFEGFVLDPSYFFERTGAGGRAGRIDFFDRQRSSAIDASYTSCSADDPDWVLRASKVSLDLEADEGVAEGAELRFLGVPILAAPRLTFPLSDARKSGWLPPDLSLDSKSGFELSLPYYWNIAPQLDATLAPGVLTRRGAALDSEFRYLDLAYRGAANLHLLPDDETANRDRHALRLHHDHELPRDIELRLRYTRASDNDYWKDFPRVLDSLTPRLLAQDALALRDFDRSYGALALYSRVQRWQVLRDADPTGQIVAPYQRAPQLGARLQSTRLAGGFELAAETEWNRFTLPAGEPDTRTTGERLHALAAFSRPWRYPGGWLTPQLTLNAASYRLDAPPPGAGDLTRTIPTLSVDSGLVFERDAAWFGRNVRQTLEPRLLYVVTPFRDQSGLPNFDSAPKDFNFESIYTDNAFSGIDRVSDAHQLTAGVTTRLLDPASGIETLRLGLVQRYLFRDQQVTPEGVPFTQRFSDLLLLGSTNLVPRWHLDASLQYSPELGRTVRSMLGARYSPGPFRTLSTRYRLARGFTEQVELAWQWPLAGRVRDPDAPRPTPLADALARTGRPLAQASAGSGRCDGAWYSVGRFNYSTRDKRITDSVVGLEYDAGCWIGRLVAERLSTGRSEATTRLLLQLELVGLSRLGSNPLSVLKDNIPGYRLLREENDRASPAATPVHD